MNIEEQFNLVAKEYDTNRKRFIPCFDDYYINSTRLILSNIKTPKSVLDLGAGTGLLTYYWIKNCNTANYLLVDIAEEMLEISRKRFDGLSNISHQILDYTEKLPAGEFDTIISALSIHHLTDNQKKELQEEVKVLDTFLYEAIFIPEGAEAPPKEIIQQAELQVYVEDFGNRTGDIWLH